MLVIHFYEAILACLAILIWHFYSTIFNPPVYPNNPSWYTRKMPLEMYRDEHADDPILAGEAGETTETAVRETRLQSETERSTDAAGEADTAGLPGAEGGKGPDSPPSKSQ
jgi:hypothetical protein